MFGLLFEYVKEDDKLLDLGIGTGLGSVPFYKIGLKIYGVDNSEEMLQICREKGIARDLKLFDLKSDKLPYDNNEFNHIISNGAFHFFREPYRILKENGTFSFTIEDNEKKDEISEWLMKNQVLQFTDTVGGILKS